METINIQNRINKIEAKKTIELQKLNLEIQGTNKTGLKCSAIDENWLSFKASNKEEIKNIIKQFKPSKNNAFLKFAGKNPIETESPFLICISNYKHIKNDKYFNLVIKYKTKDGLNIWIDIDNNTINYKTEFKQVDENSRAKYPEMYAFFTLSNEYGLKSQCYYGGSITYHGSTERILNIFN